MNAYIESDSQVEIVPDKDAPLAALLTEIGEISDHTSDLYQEKMSTLRNVLSTQTIIAHKGNHFDLLSPR